MGGRMLLVTILVLASNTASSEAFTVAAPFLVLHYAKATARASPIKMTPLPITALADYSSVAVNYFDSIRTPATLLVTTSLGFFFSLADRVKEGREQRSQLENNAIIIFHALALLSVVTSINTVMTATAGGHKLMLKQINPMAESAIHFLRREVEYEFLVTNWSFLCSLFSFLGCIELRALIEFDLIKNKRVGAMVFIVGFLSSFFFSLLSLVNDNVIMHSDFGSLTWKVLTMCVQRMTTKPSLAQSLSLVGVLASVGAVFKMLLISARFSKKPNEDDKKDM
jgi:hypothetical protein